MRRIAMTTAWVLAAVALIALPVRADCAGNLLRNQGFEGGFYPGTLVGTSVSSHIANDWLPWAVLGDPTRTEVGYNFEPEYKILNRSELSDGWYRVYQGERAQAFFSMYSTHTAGFYQQVRVPRGSRVTFTIWVQIYTGQEDIVVDGRYSVSDLVQPLTEPTRSVKGPGDYRVSVGIDPYGDTPDGFGAPLPDTIVWSQPVLDVDTRSYDAAGNPVDEWVQLMISTIALADEITVYTRGQPDFRTKHNDSYWDDACLVAAAAETPTPTPRPTETPRPSPTLAPSPTPLPTATATQTPLPMPSPTATEMPLPTIAPTETPTLMAVTVTLPTSTPIATPPPAAALVVNREVEAQWLAEQGGPPVSAPAEEPRAERSPLGLALLYIVNGVLVFLLIYWIRMERRG